MSVVSLDGYSLYGDNSLLMGRRSRSKERKESVFSFVRKFRKMSKDERRSTWRAISPQRKAAFMLVAAPALIPLLAAAGIAATGAAAAMPLTAAAIARRAAKKARKRTKYPRTLAGFMREFRSMSKEERREAWKSIPRARKAAWLLLAGPALLPLLAAAGIAITGAAAAAPGAFLMLRKRIKARRERLARLNREVVEARAEAVDAHNSGNTAGEAAAIQKEVNAKSEIATETTALKSEEEQVSAVNRDAGGTGTEETTPEVSPEAVRAADTGTTATPPEPEPKKKGNAAALIPIGALAALMFL